MKRIVTVRNAAGREQEITIHEARSDDAACSKAIREAGKRQSGGPWYAVTVREAGEIRASLTPADQAWLEGETRRGFGPSARARLARELGIRA